MTDEKVTNRIKVSTKIDQHRTKFIDFPAQQ